MLKFHVLFGVAVLVIVKLISAETWKETTPKMGEYPSNNNYYDSMYSSGTMQAILLPLMVACFLAVRLALR